MKILHLYHDIMNLYGEYANVLAMQKILRTNGIECSVERKSLGDMADLGSYDFIYVGSGTERKQKVVLDDIRRFSQQISDCIDNGTVVLMTGNSFEMLGKKITDSGKRVYDGLGIFGFSTTEQNKTRTTADAVFSASFLDEPLVGFVNKCSEIKGVDTPLFEVQAGLGNDSTDRYEGIRQGNFFGTHLTGPVLVKNPYFLEYVARLVAGDKISLDKEAFGYEIAGFEITRSELLNLNK